MDHIWDQLCVCVFYIFLYITFELQKVNLFTLCNIEQSSEISEDYFTEVFILLTIEEIQKFKEEPTIINIPDDASIYDLITKYKRIQEQEKLIFETIVRIEGKLKQLNSMHTHEIWKGLKLDIDSNLETIKIQNLFSLINDTLGHITL